MTPKFTPLIAVLMSLLSLVGCSKEDVFTDPTELEGTWAITEIESDAPYDWDGNGQQERDILSTYSPCERDIVLVFERNGVGQISEGCTDPFSYFNWEYTGARLWMEIPSGDLDLEIRQANSNSIRGTDYVQVGGRTFGITYTLTRRQRG